jgi:toxin ParE1/3/4
VTTPVRFTPEARTDFLEAFDWYEGKRPGLGAVFSAAIDEALARLQPSEVWPEVDSRGGVPIRSAIVRRFPFRVVFLVVRDEVRVLAVAHVRRAPGYWHDRA